MGHWLAIAFCKPQNLLACILLLNTEDTLLRNNWTSFHFLVSLFGCSTHLSIQCQQGFSLLGKPKKECSKKDYREALNTFLACKGLPLLSDTAKVDVYLRLKLKSQTVTSTSYDKAKKTCSYCLVRIAFPAYVLLQPFLPAPCLYVGIPWEIPHQSFLSQCTSPGEACCIQTAESPELQKPPRAFCPKALVAAMVSTFCKLFRLFR